MLRRSSAPFDGVTKRIFAFNGRRSRRFRGLLRIQAQFPTIPVKTRDHRAQYTYIYLEERACASPFCFVGQPVRADAVASFENPVVHRFHWYSM